jgi:L-asparaginase
MSKRHIVIVTTGGTIAMKKDEATGALVPAVSGEELTRSVPGLSDAADIEVREFANRPSEYMLPQHMLELCHFIDQTVDELRPDGIVVTHGTDTMEETAFFLEHTLHTEIPVCLTGAMRGASAAGADGPANILAAVRTASSGEAAGLGVLVVMNDRVYLADEVEKTHSTATDTFDSNALGPVGFVYEDRVVMRPVQRKKVKFQPEYVDGKVWILTCGAGMDDSICQAAAEAGIHGLVVEGFGCGNVPLALAAGMKSLVKEGIPVVLTTRTWRGRIQKEYGGDGGTAALLSSGIISGGGLSGQKARILLLLALGEGRTMEGLRFAFYDVCGA